MGSGNVAAEHHGVIAIFKQGTDVPDERGQLGIALLAGQALCFGNEVVQAAGVLHLGGGLQVTAHEVVGFAIVQALVTEQVVIHHGAFQPRGQGLDGRRRRRGHTAQQGQSGVPDEAGATLLRVLLFNGFRHFSAVVLHGIEERTPFAAELVGELGFHAAGETPSILGFSLPLDDVFAAALHKMAGEFLTQRIGGRHAPLQRCKARIEQRQQVVEGGFVTGVRGGG